jgi:hypothetical protein
VQRALIGAVPANLRQVSCGMEGHQIKLLFVFDGEISPEDYESARVVGTDVTADFYSPWTVVEEITRLDFPEDLRKIASDTKMMLAYQRKERPITQD